MFLGAAAAAFVAGDLDVAGAAVAGGDEGCGKDSAARGTNRVMRNRVISKPVCSSGAHGSCCLPRTAISYRVCNCSSVSDGDRSLISAASSGSAAASGATLQSAIL